MSDRRTVLVIGGPEAGKSNYIFRLWLALRDHKQRTIMADGLPDELEYLAKGADTLLGGAFAGHTPAGTGSICDIPITANEESASLIIPDRPGEEWMRLYTDRRWPSEWDSLITAGTTCLVFIRANSPVNQAPLDWLSVQRFFGHNKANLDGSVQLQNHGTPTQVIVVEWLQMLESLFRKRMGFGFRPRIGIVVTAWDVLSEAEQGIAPSNFLRRHFPLLGSFIQSNVDRIDMSVFGTSLFGGDFQNEAGFRDRFLREGKWSERGYVLHDNLRGTVRRSIELTLPVEWALGVLEQ